MNEGAWDAALRRAFSAPASDEADLGGPTDQTIVAGRLPGDLLAAGFPRRHGRYLIEAEIGRGGMGRVFRALDEDLRRPVALKVLPEISDHGRQARFLAEARVVAGLVHPGIVAIHDFGLDAVDHPYFTMRLIEGRTLAEELAIEDLTNQRRVERLKILEQVSQTVASAHARGVQHRDLKPANVMLGAYGEVLVLDWGLAVAEDSENEPEEFIAGTPTYMAPEQARGGVGREDPRCDVFALGAMLFEILTGTSLRPAHAGLAEASQGLTPDGRTRLESQSDEDELVPLVIACLAEDPKNRPANAEDVARILERTRRTAETRATEARLAGAAAIHRARNERRLRHITTLAGFLAIVLTIALAILLVRDERERRGRLARNEAALLDTLEDLEQGIAQGNWPGSREILAQATRLAATDGLNPTLRDRVAKAGTKLESSFRLDAKREAEARRREDLQRRIESALALPAETLGGGSHELQGAFLDHGLDVLGEGPQVAAVIGKQDPETRSLLLRALDHWASRLRPRSEDRRCILEVALKVDQRPWPRRLRRAILDDDDNALRELARILEAKTREAPELELLAVGLLDEGEREAALSVFRRALDVHPGDFWLHLRTCAALAGINRSPRRQDSAPSAEEHAEAIVHARIAGALRPESTVVPRLLARIHAAAGTIDEAIAALDAAAERGTEAAELLVEKARLLRLDQRYSEMHSVALRAASLAPTNALARSQLHRALELGGGGPKALSEWADIVASWAATEVPETIQSEERALIAAWRGDLPSALDALSASRPPRPADLISIHFDALLSTNRLDEARELLTDIRGDFGRRKLERRLNWMESDNSALGRARRCFTRGDLETAAALYVAHVDELELPLESPQRLARSPEILRAIARDAERALLKCSLRAEANANRSRARALRDAARNLFARELRASRRGLRRPQRLIKEQVRSHLFSRLHDEAFACVRENLDELQDPQEAEAWRALWTRAGELLFSD